MIHREVCDVLFAGAHQASDLYVVALWVAILICVAFAGVLLWGIRTGNAQIILIGSFCIISLWALTATVLFFIASLVLQSCVH